MLIAAMQQADGGSREADQAEAQKRRAAAEDERAAAEAGRQEAEDGRAAAEAELRDAQDKIRAEGRLSVVNFAAGGIATPADAALMMQLGLDGVFVGSGIFKSTDPAKRAKAIVAADNRHQQLVGL